MNRREMIDELLERLETELDELSNGQLNNLIEEYEHMPLLGGIVESVTDPDDDEDADVSDEEQLPLIDGDWSEDADDSEEEDDEEAE